ncbi:uncharacterized protein EHS24_008914 [Apiotrichum porosum]|uniref:Uncharacterized protein n=1 Tax=Apiotrichum porosum TaxID=105984 RepID=A0A427XNI2_9TREE|nr:uncharacterized protein EHS24_008914 [Apiotrichum porosum]RSH80338.1 hypothetical protein EHS24_008914 [Apiotrichum porosum]
MANAFARPQYSDPNDLATAVRDVVHINRNGTSQPVPSSSSHLAGGGPRSASPHMPGAFQPAHTHSNLNPDAVTMSSKNKMAEAENPFAEPSEASVQFVNTSSSSGAARLSPDDRDADRDTKKAERRTERRERRQITQGQTKDAASKKGSRHADVIDTWDPTGLGSAMWHHSGPYDAAAPSRNLNQPRAPMQAFGLPGQPGGPPAAGAGAGAAAPAPPRTGPTAISLPPPVPAKTGEHERRASAAARPTSGRRSSGGLSGQYSTSVPTSGGGYFGGEAPQEDEETAWRRRQREEKQRALKAAWGIDTPEPFEDFGFSPREDTVDLADSNDYPVGSVNNNNSNNNNNRAARSPGLRLGSLGAPRSPPLPEDTAVSPTGDQPIGGFGSGGVGGRPGGGVKRTKSLMQKIKSMVRQKSDENVPPVPPALGPRSQSMSAASDTLGRHPPVSPGWRNAPVLEEEEGGSDGGYGNYNDFPAGWEHPTGATPPAAVPTRI